MSRETFQSCLTRMVSMHHLLRMQAIRDWLMVMHPTFCHMVHWFTLVSCQNSASTLAMLYWPDKPMVRLVHWPKQRRNKCWCQWRSTTVKWTICNRSFSCISIYNPCPSSTNGSGIRSVHLACITSHVTLSSLVLTMQGRQPCCTCCETTNLSNTSRHKNQPWKN